MIAVMTPCLFFAILVHALICISKSVCENCIPLPLVNICLKLFEVILLIKPNTYGTHIQANFPGLSGSLPVTNQISHCLIRVTKPPGY